ncbi:restriction endonuclease subunit S [Pseudomonas veronii]
MLISRMNTPDLVGESGYIEQDYPWLFLPDRLWMTHFRKESDINVKWLSYVLSSPEYKLRIRSNATGTSGSMKNISKGTLLSLSILLPSEAEQTAIATILSDMDSELTALETRRDKARQLKHGMMQELLTGRIRLL